MTEKAMVALKDLANLPQVTRNLRHKLYLERHDTALWGELVADALHVSPLRARQLLDGRPPEITEEELGKVARWCGRQIDDVASSPSYSSDKREILLENLRLLQQGLGAGGQKLLAKHIGVTNSTICRWFAGDWKEAPHPKNLSAALRFFGLDPELDLEVVPLFLFDAPVHVMAKKIYLKGMVDQASADEIAKHFDALRKILDPE